MSDFDPDELVTTAQIAERVGRASATVYWWHHMGHLPDPDERIGERVIRWRWGNVVRRPVVRRAMGRPQAAGKVVDLMGELERSVTEAKASRKRRPTDQPAGDDR